MDIRSLHSNLFSHYERPPLFSSFRSTHEAFPPSKPVRQTDPPTKRSSLTPPLSILMPTILKHQLETSLSHPLRSSIPIYSNSIVLGGFEVASYNTLATPLTSFPIRFVTRRINAGSNSNAFAVMKSVVTTALRAIIWPWRR